MLNSKINLNKDIFNHNVEMIPTRSGFGNGLLKVGDNKDIVAICADLKESIQMHKFAEKFPERFIEVGVAEQNLVTVASGMARVGKIPFAGSYAVFNPGRNWEQIRTTICYNNSPVKIIGSHAGLNVGPDGGSHQCLEDIALMRVLPRMIVLSPCDAIEAEKITIASTKINSPVYIRLAREKSPIITTNETPFQIGKASIIWKSPIGKSDIGIVATGPILFEAIMAARELEREKIGVTVLNLSTIKPLDEKSILDLAREVKAIVTVEEHQIFGGMGSAISEFLSENHPIKVIKIGVKDEFGQSGTKDELFKHYKIDRDSIIATVKKLYK